MSPSEVLGRPGQRHRRAFETDVWAPGAHGRRRVDEDLDGPDIGTAVVVGDRDRHRVEAGRRIGVRRREAARAVRLGDRRVRRGVRSPQLTVAVCVSFVPTSVNAALIAAGTSTGIGTGRELTTPSTGGALAIATFVEASTGGLMLSSADSSAATMASSLHVMSGRQRVAPLLVQTVPGSLTVGVNVQQRIQRVVVEIRRGFRRAARVRLRFPRTDLPASAVGGVLMCTCTL